MHQPTKDELLQSLVDRVSIQDALCRYARAVDRSDWDAVRAAYHPDAYDDHGDYKGDVNGLLEWLQARFASAENGMHFLGNCLIEFATADIALVETYFISQRLRQATKEERAVADDPICRQGWGRYVDQFERRNGEWRVLRRAVVMDATFTFAAKDGARSGPALWGQRNSNDPLYRSRDALLGKRE